MCTRNRRRTQPCGAAIVTGSSTGHGGEGRKSKKKGFKNRQSKKKRNETNSTRGNYFGKTMGPKAKKKGGEKRKPQGTSSYEGLRQEGGKTKNPEKKKRGEAENLQAVGLQGSSPAEAEGTKDLLEYTRAAIGKIPQRGKEALKKRGEESTRKKGRRPDRKKKLGRLDTSIQAGGNQKRERL